MGIPTTCSFGDNETRNTTQQAGSHMDEHCTGPARHGDT